MKKTIPFIPVLLCLALVCGCSGKEAEPAPTAAPVETAAPTAVPEPTDTPAPLSDTISVTDEQSVSAQKYTVFCDSEAIYSVEEGKLVLTGCSFDQTNTESGKGSDGTLIIVNGGTLNLNECTVSSSADLTTAMENCSGMTEVSGSVLLLSGDNSVLFSAFDEASLRISESMLALSGTDEIAFSLSGSTIRLENSSVTNIEDAETTAAELTDSTLIAAGSNLSGSVTARFGNCGIALDRSDWAGTLNAFDEAESVTLTLKNLSSFTGSIPDGSESVELAIDSISHLTLTDDSYVAVIKDEDTSFSNISGNGFNLYYNGELEVNAALASGTYPLKDGGYLIPLI